MAKTRVRKKLVVHIGMGKTGTTALQQFFLKNRRRLNKHGICYPKFGLRGGAHHLLSPFKPPFIGDAWKFKQPAEWIPVLRQAPQDTIVLSSELMAWAEPDAVKAFCRQVQEVFDLIVVIYLRRQDEVIMASYSQMIKAGTQKQRIDKVYKNQIPRFDYLRIVETWGREVGTDRLIIRPYEKQQFFGGDIRLDFMQHALGISDCSDLPLSTEDFNPRLSLAASEYKRMVNSLVGHKRLNHQFNRLLSRYSQDTGKPPATLRPAQREEILTVHREGNRQIAVDYLDRPDGRLFLEPEIDPVSEYATQELPAEETAAISRYLWRRNPILMWLLRRRINNSIEAEDFLQRTAAQRLRESLR